MRLKMKRLRWNTAFTPLAPPANARTMSTDGEHNNNPPNNNSAESAQKPHTTPTAATGTASNSTGNSSMANDEHPQFAVGTTAKCAKCDTPFGRITNAWNRVSNSYFTPTFHHAGRDGLSLQSEGDARHLASSNEHFEGCLIQALVCKTCASSFAFECIETPPDKGHFARRIFFKLKKIILIAPEGQVVTPDVSNDPISNPQGQSPPAAPDTSDTHDQKNKLNPVGSKSTSASISSPNMPDVEDSEALADADHEAADSIEQGGQWRIVHELWSRRTRRNLSPASFGRRIQTVQVRRKAPPSRDQSPSTHRLSISRRPQHPQTLPSPLHHQRSSECRPMVNGSQSQPGQSSPVYGRPAMDSLHVQRADINRIDGAVGRLQMDMRSLRAAVDTLRQDFRRRSGSSDDTEPTMLDALSDSVAHATAKAGEIDGIKIQIDHLKRRMRRLEEGSGNPPTPPQAEASQRPSTSQPAHALPPPPPPAIPPRHAPIAPSPNVEAEPRGWNALNTVKRKSPPDADEYDPQTGAKRVKPAGHPQPYIENLTRSGQEAPRLAPIRTLSQQDSHEWHPPTLPAIRSAPYAGPGRRPGRPPKAPPENIGTPPWERDSWAGPEADPDGYYRPLGGVPQSPSTLDRGRLVRRGSAGGIQYMDHAAVAKKTRQKPIRNSEGVLIRKDGKPDQRSISSPMNLKKVHARKLVEAEGSTGRRDSMSNPTSPMAFSPGATEGGEGEDEDSPESARGGQSKGSHSAIMRQMFPHGVADDASRINHASQLLSPSHAADMRVQTKGNMMKEDPQSSDDSSRRSSDNMAAGQSAERSHSMYYRMDARSSSKELSRDSPRSTEPSVAAASRERTESAPNIVMKDAPSAQAEARQQESGSVYQPSENVGESAPASTYQNGSTYQNASTYQTAPPSSESMPPPSAKASVHQPPEMARQDSGSLYEPSQDVDAPAGTPTHQIVVQETPQDEDAEAIARDKDKESQSSY